MTLASSDGNHASTPAPSEATVASKKTSGKRRDAVQDEPYDLVEAREKPVDALPGFRGGSATTSAASSGETLVTDDERAKVPPFCELKKVITPKGELIYVGWDGPDDPKNPRNVSERSYYSSANVIGSLTDAFHSSGRTRGSGY